ncbi:UDP-forming cellulose synthase catalytic subunit [Pelagibacterium halotolerans]|uniref:Cellulose synthase catalytic subunit [UDP-forming] n=1 Tax=Pelagibacterium halotolerans (strain DSM 22347 / JCM 15775 / CGMCC 1.7692 / B2) TaxID=1082931 RepID=G4RFY7_PELHB|nr:UDP-forming cellulose synthase catalytic subunit [Pelagibacterium halotolerans]AEQ51030.1 cellulose synthase catalytic subunit (UDP-forming) [Pelagibacterium halotolerans B2]QJR19082.1 UDP-forming cellulose synthase catalytic subunit [Pelagibacterium halotolerans]SEA02952.1 cellulose synthase (UDP-forming) [Pelagibacterium halotolerans]
MRAITFLFWALVATGTVIAITLPVSLQVHLITAVLFLGVMLVIKTLRLGGVWRLLLLALGTAIVLRYAYWRTTSTLPPVEQWADFIPGLLLYLGEMYCILMLALSLFVISNPVPSRPSRSLKPGEPVPSVDVFVPTYNEDYELLAGTLAAAKALDYPAEKLTIWLLDDGGTVQKRNDPDPEKAEEALERHTSLEKLCSDLGVNYLTRERNEHAKAGNLNNGLAHSTGDLVAVFDADHAPARDFLQETVPYFGDDEKLFLVQTPHFFLNPDPLERNLRTFERMPSENEMFYSILQRGLDSWNASFFCGSAALLRREALDIANGFSGRSITEDCETALDLHSKKWNSIYIDRPLIAGLQPATFSSFIGQRTRWAQGMTQIMLFNFPLFKRGLSMAQRLCYMSSMMFWLFPFTRIIFLIAPFFYLFFNLQIFTASGGEFAAYTMTYLVVNLVMQNSLYGRWRWPWISELYEYIQSVHLLPAILSVIRNPTKPTFKVTAKDESIDESRLSELARPFYFIFLLLLVGVAFTGYRLWAEPYRAEITLVVGGWNLFNLILAGCALGVVSERREVRASRRVPIERRCEIRSVDGTWVRGTILNVSSGGVAIQVADGKTRLAKDQATAIRFQTLSPVPDNEMGIFVRNVSNAGKSSMVGCRFMAEKPSDYRLIADLLYANSKLWKERQESRQVNIGIILGTLQFLSISIYQTARGLGYLARFSRPAGSDQPQEARS